ncbi:hypothetical protein [Erythrobacter sp. SD-21]|uniref:hypothetical protein n=1 Tax=Erythrobacter sp. SD-21 TaxID=161528 RepID=UPI000153F82C|nr:hypothetical protein [Erythrobacter sp. SD-21]EDL49936.1 hypothetical protein ED21_25733 [Erythrobacter sp. SD-21]
MNLSLALSKSIDTPSLPSGLQGATAPETVDVEGADGFSVLLESLALIAPSAVSSSDVAAPTLEARPFAELPAGIILPFSASVLPVEHGAHGEANDALIASTPVQARFSGLTLDPNDGAAASVLGPKTASTPDLADLQDISGQRSRGTVHVSVSTAAQPLDATMASRVTVATTAHSAGQGEGRVAEPLTLNPTVSTTASKTEAMVAAAQVAQTASSENTGAPRGSAADKTENEKRGASVGVPGPTEMAKPLGQNPAISFQDAFSLARPATSAPRPVDTDLFAHVERVVEKLNAARQFDLSKPASISLAHRDFGALTVTFNQSEAGVEVEIAAENRDAQRALAAAMASERGPTRSFENGPQTTSGSSQHFSASSERGHSSNDGGATSSPSHSGGKEHRSDSSEQRARHSENPSLTNRPSEQPSDDSGLYA